MIGRLIRTCNLATHKNKCTNVHEHKQEPHDNVQGTRTDKVQSRLLEEALHEEGVIAIGATVRGHLEHRSTAAENRWLWHRGDCCTVAFAVASVTGIAVVVAAVAAAALILVVVVITFGDAAVIPPRYAICLVVFPDNTIDRDRSSKTHFLGLSTALVGPRCPKIRCRCVCGRSGIDRRLVHEVLECVEPTFALESCRHKAPLE